MMPSHYAALEPACIFKWFRAISDIPRASGHEEAVAAFLRDFAQKRGLVCECDPLGNVLLRLPASPGMEREPPLLLQAHTDMVCAKEAGVEFDFERDPIRFRIEEGVLRADGTTLGADAGAGVAVMLSLGDDPALAHPPLELLFTVQEEIGLKGIRAFDCSSIRARRMINLDSGYSHVVCLSGAGAVTAEVSGEFLLSAADAAAGLRLTLSGGSGGHSGIMIRRGRVCALNAMGELLHELSTAVPFRLRSFHTQEETGVLLSDCTAEIGLSRAEDVAAARSAVEGAWVRLRARYARCDPGLRLTLGASAPEGELLNATDTRAVLDAMLLFHSGVCRLDSEDPRVTLSSAACGVGFLENGRLRFEYRLRSSDRDELFFLQSRARRTARLLGLSLTITDAYGPWPYRPGSPLLQSVCAAHRRLFDCEIDTEHVHGGIEVGVILEAIPDMDAIGLSPTATQAHTTAECLHIREVEPFWRLLLAVLKGD